MKRIRYIPALFLLIVFYFGDISPAIAHVVPEAGFYSLEENNFYFHTQSYFNRIALRSSRARIWYSYQPAEKNPASKPLFVFFNGGPGGATSSGLMSAFTGPNAVTIDPESEDVSITSNPYSWTDVGNLLYLDARTTGFSYSLMENPGDDTARQAEFDLKNYNCFIDGADFVRVLLRFLSDHPPLQQNPVIIAGESYGGIRSTVMLHLLLYYRIYGNGQSLFQDPNLVQEIQNHYNTVFPQYAGQPIPQEVIAQQFSHQILIQPAVTRNFQRQVAAQMLETPGSIIYQLAEETGVPYIRWEDQPHWDGTYNPYQIMNNIYDYLEKIGRDPYIVTMPDGFLKGYFESAGALLTQYDDLCRMTGVDVAGIPEMYAVEREQAYKSKLSSDTAFMKIFSTLMGPRPKTKDLQKMIYPAAESDLSALFGNLQPWDRYFIDLNYDANTAFYLNRAIFIGHDIYYRRTDMYGRMFLENTAWSQTFITNAAFDIVVYSPAIPDALALHSSILQSSHHDTDGPHGEERPGQIHLNYRQGSIPDANITTRTIRFPFYPKSCHAVTLTEPEEILADISTWLEATGLDVSNNRGGKK